MKSRSNCNQAPIITTFGARLDIDPKENRVRLELTREIREMRYAGTYTAVERYLATMRRRNSASTV